MPYLTRDDVRLFYTDEGSGPVALLLHGWACDSHDWSWQIPVLTGTYRVVALDQRGHGRSSAPEGSYQAQVLADDAAALLHEVAPGQPALVIGHSMGTIVASALSVRHPELVQALVLVDPVYGAEDERVAPVLAALRGPAPAETAARLFGAAFYNEQTPEFLRVWHRRRVLGTPDHVVAGAFIGLFEGEDALGRSVVARDYLAQRRHPRLAVYADKSAAEFERQLPVGKQDAVHIADGGHFLHQQSAREFNEIMMAWLAALPADEPSARDGQE